MSYGNRGANRDITDGYPYPIASTYMKIYQDATPGGRHDRLRDLFQVTLQFLASVMLVQYARDRKRDKATYDNAAINDSLADLARPSMGHWLRYLRDLIAHYDKIGKRDQLFFPQLAEVYNRKGNQDQYKAMLAAYNMIRREYENQPNQQNTVTLGQFIEKFILYRNRVIGHGTAQTARFYSEKLLYLLPAMEEMLLSLQFIAETPLVYVERVEFNDRGELQHHLVRYNGTSYEYEQTPFITQDLAQRRLPRQLYLARITPTTNAEYGNSALQPELSLHPLMILSTAPGMTEPEIFMLSRAGEKELEYISYVTGAVTGEGELRKAFDSFLSGNGATTTETKQNGAGPAAPPPTQEPQVDDLKKRVQESLDKQLWDQARQQVNAVLAVAPADNEMRQLGERLDRMQTLYNQASAAMQSKNWGQASSLLEQLSTLNAGYRNVADLIQEVGREREQANIEQERMLAQLRDALKQSLETHQWDAAQQDAEAIMKLNPNDADARAAHDRLAMMENLYTQARAALQTEDMDAAHTALDRLNEIEPDYRDLPELLQQVETDRAGHEQRQQALAAVKQRRWDEAMPLLQAALAVAPNDTELAGALQKLEALQADYQIGTAAMQAGHWSVAHDAFGRVLSTERNYRDTPALANQVDLALNRAEMKRAAQECDWDDAQRAAATVVRLDPSDAEARALLDRLVMLSSIYRQSMQAIQTASWLDAREALHRLIGLEPEYRDAPVLLKRVEVSLDQQVVAIRMQLQEALAAKRWDEALTLVNALLARAPDDSEAVQTRDRLTGLQDLYISARAAIERKSWIESLALLRQISNREADYRDVAGLTQQVQAESQLANLYAQAKGFIAAGEWKEAQPILQKIRDQRPNYMDVTDLLRQAEQKMTRACPKCGTIHPITRRFCNICGTNIDEAYSKMAQQQQQQTTAPQYQTRVCPKCGTQTKATNRFCNKCGTLLPPVQVAAPPATRTCSFCGTAATHKGKFCLQCGKPLPPIAG